ncbi:unnamed protein product [Rotaria sordida]|uniref:Uncharacterized protein n=1 Tax=Rotaria sordida TaxID=392033 RepID=A0A819SPH8_9BILA|nr:unnamed protein product [Rotaria sordida]
MTVSADTEVNGVGDDIERYHQEIFEVVTTGDLKRFNDILDELDRHKLPTIKKKVLNMGYQEADGLTALSIAAGEKHKSITKTLAKCSEVDVNKASFSGITPLLMVAEVGWPDILDILLERGAIVDATPSDKRGEDNKISGSTPLINATKYNHPECVKRLLVNHANPNHQNQSGISALMLAAEQGYFECIKLLVQAGADLDLAPSGPGADNLNITGQTALFMATLKDRVDVVKYLIEKGADVNVQNFYGISPLFLCVESGNGKLVQALIEAGAHVNFTPEGELAEENFLVGQTPLFSAAKSGHVEICEYLIKNGADVNAVTMTGASPLYTAIEEGHLEVVILLIRYGANVNQSPKGQVARDLHIENQTPLLIACMKNHEAIIRYLIQSGANVNLTSEHGTSPFLAICQHNNVILARLLIRHGARYDVETKNRYDGKINSLIIAAESGSFDIVRLLVEIGLDVNYKIEGTGETAGRTPLFHACAKGFQDIVEYLIDHGADVNATEDSGLSCLHIAAAMGHADIVRILCEHNVNVNQRYRFEEQDVTAYDLAECQQHNHTTLNLTSNKHATLAFYDGKSSMNKKATGNHELHSRRRQEQSADIQQMICSEEQQQTVHIKYSSKI